VTLKTGLGFVQGHWKWHHLIDRIRVLIPFHSKYGDILHRLRDIATYWSKIANFFYTPPYLAPPQGVTPSEFREDVWCWWKQNDWGYRTVKKLWRYVKPYCTYFLLHVGNLLRSTIKFYPLHTHYQKYPLLLYFVPVNHNRSTTLSYTSVPQRFNFHLYQIANIYLPSKFALYPCNSNFHTINGWRRE